MDDLQKAIDVLDLDGGLEISGRPRKIAEFFDGLAIAVSAMRELQRYREIGTVDECAGYKAHSKSVSELHNCND